MADPVLIVPTGDVVSETTTELEDELKKAGATHTQRTPGPGGVALIPHMGVAGVYAEDGADTNKHVIEEGWPGSSGDHHYNRMPHHQTVVKHTYTPAEMEPTTVGEIRNIGGGKILAALAPSEDDFMHDGIANGEYDSLRLTHDTGLVWIFHTPIHVLETQAVIFNEMTGAVTDTGILSYSKDTTDGIDGKWMVLSHHIVDISSAGVLPDEDFAPAGPPLLTNIEGVKAIKVMGPALAIYLVELNIWVPKVVTP